MTVEVARRRFTVEDYYRMAKAGILTEDDRVELIEGEIVQIAPIGSRHAAGVKTLIHLFAPPIHGRALIGAQDPLHLSEFSEPEPDFVLLRPRDDHYAAAHPGPADLLLLVEVSDTTLAYDREVKLPLYARAGVPEVWIEDLASRALDVYQEPSTEGYRRVRRLVSGDRVGPQLFPDISLAVDDLLP